MQVCTTKFAGERARDEQDVLAIEEPLEIRLGWGVKGARRSQTISITMRTPGSDCELAAGFLYSEGIVDRREQLCALRHCARPIRADGSSNVVRAELDEGVEPDMLRLERHVYTSSSCGVCCKTSLDAVRTLARHRLGSGPQIASDVVHLLPERLRSAQIAFAMSGGLHAAGLFDARGRLLAAREDVGRHNALDKLIGRQFLRGDLPCHRLVLMVSGRASFELAQKAVMAGIPVLAAVGAPSSLAVELAREAGMTLLGFVRDGRFNVYSGAERLERRPERGDGVTMEVVDLRPPPRARRARPGGWSHRSLDQ